MFHFSHCILLCDCRYYIAETIKMAENEKQARVILWGVPRCVSTSFLKCLTFVEDSVCWYEPYLMANMMGTDGTLTPFLQQIMKEFKVSEHS